MEFLRLEADDYESALRLARQQWGSAVRIHTRREIKKGRKDKRCEITFYLVDLTQQQRYKSEQHLDRLLEINGIPFNLPSLDELREACAHLQEAEVEMRLIETLLHSIDYTTEFDAHHLVIRGEEAVSIALKVAQHFIDLGKNVTLISDAQAPSIIEEYASQKNIAVHIPDSEEDLAHFDHVISIGDVEEFSVDNTLTLYAVDSHQVTEQLDEIAPHTPLILTNFASLEQVGQLLTSLAQEQLPLAFIDQTLEDESVLERGSASLFLPKFAGFVLDLDALSF